MSESSDYTPSRSYSGYDFREERRSYERHREKKHEEEVKPKKKTAKKKTCLELIEPRLTSNAEAAIIYVSDVSGSMGGRAGVVVEKAPYVDYECREYLGQSLVFGFLAVSDVHARDEYPFQAPSFAGGDKIPEAVKKLITTEKGGGDGIRESYEVAAIYACRNIHLPNANKKIVIFIADEIPYDTLHRTHAKIYAKTDVNKEIPTKQVFEELNSKGYAVYVIHFPYGGISKDNEAVTREVYEHWVKLVGADHIASLSDNQRTVDVVFGILAKETGRVPYFYQELTERQMKDSDGLQKIAQVKAAMVNIHAGIDIESDNGSTETETLF